MNKPAKCPACNCEKAIPLESIRTLQQHLSYVRNNFDVAQRLTKLLPEDLQSYSMFRCMECGLEYADPLFCPNGDWYSLLYANTPLYPQERWEYKFVTKKLTKEDRVLDYGCGDGAFLQYARPHVSSLAGLDFSPSAVEELRAKGIPVFTEIEFGKAPDRFTAIVAFHVLEHLATPSQLFHEMSRVACSGATLWVAIPSEKRASRVYGQIDHLDQPPHHMTRWTSDSLSKIAMGSGWTLDDIFYEPITTKSAVWHIAVRRPAYKYVKDHGKSIERIGRFLISVPVYLQRKEIKRISGFTMLAKYSLSK